MAGLLTDFEKGTGYITPMLSLAVFAWILFFDSAGGRFDEWRGEERRGEKRGGGKSQRIAGNLHEHAERSFEIQRL